MHSRQFSATIFTLKLILDVKEVAFKLARKFLSYYYFLTDFRLSLGGITQIVILIVDHVRCNVQKR